MPVIWNTSCKDASFEREIKKVLLIVIILAFKTCNRFLSFLNKKYIIIILMGFIYFKFWKILSPNKYFFFFC